MASIRKHRQKYQVQVRRKGSLPITKVFLKRADAEEWARFIETKLDRGELPTPVKALEGHKLKHIIIRYRDEISVKKKSYHSHSFIKKI